MDRPMTHLSNALWLREKGWSAWLNREHFALQLLPGIQLQHLLVAWLVVLIVVEVLVDVVVEMLQVLKTYYRP